MTILQSVILGLVQGLTEFLPVSSSGHLVLLENIFGIANVSTFFDVMLHAGTLVAVVIVLRREIAGLILHPVKNHLLILVIATLPAIAMTLAADKLFPEVFADIRDGRYLAAGFYATAGVLVVSELIARRIEQKKPVLLPQALAMGLMQAAAIAPGLSRSGSTIAGGLFTGVRREQAAKFAFLMSIPAILGGVVFDAAAVAQTGLGDVSIPALLAGVCVAGVSGFFAITFMLKLISKHKLYGFAVYPAILGTFVLLSGVV
jgi:undecaprenyl-diphosphatase